MPIGLMVIDSMGAIVAANRALSEILGYPKDSFTSKDWGKIFFDNEENINFNQVIIDVIREQKMNLRRVVSYAHPAGHELQLSVTTSFLREEEEIAGIVVLIDDMTEISHLHEREKAILEENRRIQHERAESLQKLALAVAHQIRNPVVSIGGFAMRMIKKNTEKEQNTIYLENILSGTNRLEDIVKAVMDYTEIPAVDLDALDLRKLLDNVRVLIDEKAGKLTLDLNWNIKCGAVNAVLDPELVGQALNEILTNSLESFSGGKGSIDITVSKDNTVFSMKIIDNGSGISEEDMPYIFDPFFTTKAVGSGMGLCKAVKIIREHKGDLLIHSKAGIGTTATIRLPANP